MNPLWLDAVVLLTTGSSVCAGTLVDTEGSVLTAYHCVANGLPSSVELHDGRVLRGRTVAADPEHDLALVVLIEAPQDVAPLRLADAPPVQGSEVWAIGHPFASAASGALEGTLVWSVTRGVISAAGSNFLQTDAALNPGNSGGPLISGDGRLVGVVSRKLAGDNVAFATHASFAAAILRDRPRPSVLGGTYGLAAALVPLHDGAYALTAEIGVVARERVWARLQVGGGLGSDPTMCVRPALGLRQRLGGGPLSTAFDLGAAWTAEAPTEPEIVGRLTLAGVGLGGMWVPGANRWGVELSASLPFHGVW